MKNQEKAPPNTIKFKDMNLSNLLLLFNTGFSETVSVKSLYSAPTEEKKEDVEEGDRNERYSEEKRLFLSFLMESSSSSMVNTLNNFRYDYMNGFLLFLSANDCFHYGFGYFKDKQEKYGEFIGKWNAFINNLIADIVMLPEIMYPTPIVIEINGFFMLTVVKDSIVSVDLNQNWFDRIFNTESKQYEFRLMASEKPNEKSIIESGFGNGKGKASGLCKSLENLNDLIESIQRKERLNVEEWYGQE